MHPNKIFVHYLERMRAMLKKIELFEVDISCNRLHPDMFPLLQQARIAIGFTLRCCCPLANREKVSFAGEELSFSAVFDELDKSLNYLRSFREAEFQGMDTMTITTTAGFADQAFSGPDYFQLYCLPNFMFHYCMVYALARQAGVSIGKGDFDGYHDYPAGFMFTKQSEGAQGVVE
jgi:uncharacterized protein